MVAGMRPWDMAGAVRASGVRRVAKMGGGAAGGQVRSPARATAGILRVQRHSPTPPCPTRTQPSPRDPRPPERQALPVRPPGRIRLARPRFAGGADRHAGRRRAARADRARVAQMLEGVLRMADMSAGDVMVAAPRMDLLDIDAPYDELLARGHRHRAFALPGLRGPARQHHRHPDGQGPAEAAARARAEPAHAAAPGGVRARVEAPERAAARLPLQPQPPGDRHRRVRQDRRADHHRGRARRDRRRDRGRVRRPRRRERHLHAGRRHAARRRRHLDRVGQRGLRPALPEGDFDTIGGLVAHELGRVPRRGETVDLGSLRFAVMLARGGAVRWFRVARLPRRPRRAQW